MVLYGLSHFRVIVFLFFVNIMNGPPNDIIQWKRDKMNYQRHVKRLQSVKPCVDINPPSSLGLKHLETRAKKKQLQEDRQQVVARQNKVLMDNMMAVMLPHISLNNVTCVDHGGASKSRRAPSPIKP